MPRGSRFRNQIKCYYCHLQFDPEDQGHPCRKGPVPTPGLTEEIPGGRNPQRHSGAGKIHGPGRPLISRIAGYADSAGGRYLSEDERQGYNDELGSIRPERLRPAPTRRRSMVLGKPRVRRKKPLLKSVPW